MMCTRSALLVSVIAATTIAVGQAPSGIPLPNTSVTIPGPLKSMLRLAAVSTKINPEQVLPLVARNVFTHGYESWGSSRQPTEFMILLKRYVQQARDLRALADSDGVIRVASCDQAGRLLAVLGYRLRQKCGSQTSLETADASRAFVTLYSAFPLTELEDALRAGKTFTYTYPATEVPVVFSRDDWLDAASWGNQRTRGDLLDAILNDVGLARLYWAMSRLDVETRDALRASLGVRRLLPYAAMLDFYGGELSIHSGHLVVPGGPSAEPAWQRLIGASPNAGADFAMRMMTKDSGWAAVLFDVLSQTDAAHQRYFTDPSRLEKFYDALRGHDPSPGPAHAVFRSDTAVFLLASRLALDEDGQPLVPGNVELWSRILRHNPDGGPARTADDLVSVLFRLGRRNATSELVELYLVLGEMDRPGRNERLSPETVKLLAEKFSRYRDYYSVFCEFHSLNDQSIQRFFSVAETLDRIRDLQLRTDAIGSFQANVALWQILSRQGEISKAEQNESWQKMIAPFYKVHSSPQLFDASHASLRAVLHAASGNSELSQDDVIALLAGPLPMAAESRKVHRQLVDDISVVMAGQRLVPLDTLFAFRDGLEQLANGKTVEGLLPMAERLREFEMPRPLFTGGERSEWANGVSTATTHDEAQTRVDWVRVVTKQNSRGELEKARGKLAPILRDSLVGLVYAYYAPPGAQMVHNNALFVRSHDFSGTVNGGAQSWRTPIIMGSGTPAARGARLVGSLADLPYVLAQVEQDFMVPENEQALMLDETAPTLMLSAVVPRWWQVSASELHAVALYQRGGEELLRSSMQDDQTRKRTLSILSECMFPVRVQQIQDAFRNPAPDPLPELAPSESFYLAREFQRRFPDATDSWGPAGHELAALLHNAPDEVRWERLSQDFGVPHPALAHTYARALLLGKPSPAMMDYGSRLFAESWQSNNLYWARLADEQGYAPVVLNRLAPRLTRRMLEKIFATDLADWPALFRALRETGDEFRRGAMDSKTTTAAAQ